ncbi:MAG: (5-formylfuran-3-yl)methyl phosphate synthase [Methylococcales bacterium]
MTGFLASVSTIEEALLAERLGADIIDLKNPMTGALGAISPENISAIVAALDNKTIVSATIGDLPLLPELIVPAVQETAATGVDFIKIGLFNNGDLLGCMTALQALIKRDNLALIAVLFADQPVDLEQINHLANYGIRGVMLDTANKSSGSLCSLLSIDTLSTFIEEARHNNLLCGLAGSLRLSDIETLAALNPDYLGFRGALCEQSQRTASITAHKIRAIRKQLSVANNSLPVNGTTDTTSVAI